MAEKNPGGYIGEAMRAYEPQHKRKRKTLAQRAQEWGERSTTVFKYDGMLQRYIARHAVVDAWVSGYRAGKRDAQKEARRG